MEKLLQINSIQPVQTPLPAGTVQPASALSRMQSGDTVSARVIESGDGSLKLSLSDGTTLRASMKAGQPLQAQDTLLLQLTSDHGSAPSLRLLSVNAQPVTADVPLLDMALLEMNLPASQANLSAAAFFAKLGLPLDAQTLSRFNTLQSAFPALPGEQAAVLAASKVTLDAQNVEAFMRFVDSPALAADAANALENALTLSGATEGGAAQSIQSAIPESGAPVLPVLQEAGSTADGTAAAAAQNTSVQNHDALTAAQDPAMEQPAAQAAAALQADMAQQAAPQASAQATRPDAQADPAQAAQTASSIDKPLFEALRALFPKLLPKESEAMGKALQKAVPALTTRIAALSETAAASNAQAAKEAARLGGQFVRQMNIGGELPSLYYTQIPFSYKENRSSAELYVLKRNRGENTIDADNATVALCLETPNMGRVETLIQTRARELSFHFRVESKAVKSLVQSELSSLSAFDFPAEYHFKGASVGLIESPITPVSAEKTMRETFGLPEGGGVDISV